MDETDWVIPPLLMMSWSSPIAYRTIDPSCVLNGGKQKQIAKQEEKREGEKKRKERSPPRRVFSFPPIHATSGWIGHPIQENDAMPAVCTAVSPGDLI